MFHPDRDVEHRHFWAKYPAHNGVIHARHVGSGGHESEHHALPEAPVYRVKVAAKDIEHGHQKFYPCTHHLHHNKERHTAAVFMPVARHTIGDGDHHVPPVSTTGVPAGAAIIYDSTIYLRTADHNGDEGE